MLLSTVTYKKYNEQLGIECLAQGHCTQTTAPLGYGGFLPTDIQMPQ